MTDTINYEDRAEFEPYKLDDASYAQKTAYDPESTEFFYNGAKTAAKGVFFLVHITAIGLAYHFASPFVGLATTWMGAGDSLAMQAVNQTITAELITILDACARHQFNFKAIKNELQMQFGYYYVKYYEFFDELKRGNYYRAIESLLLAVIEHQGKALVYNAMSALAEFALKSVVLTHCPPLYFILLGIQTYYQAFATVAIMEGVRSELSHQYRALTGTSNAQVWCTKTKEPYLNLDKSITQLDKIDTAIRDLKLEISKLERQASGATEINTNARIKTLKSKIAELEVKQSRWTRYQGLIHKDLKKIHTQIHRYDNRRFAPSGSKLKKFVLKQFDSKHKAWKKQNDFYSSAFSKNMEQSYILGAEIEELNTKLKRYQRQNHPQKEAMIAQLEAQIDGVVNRFGVIEFLIDFYNNQLTRVLNHEDTSVEKETAVVVKNLETQMRTILKLDRVVKSNRPNPMDAGFIYQNAFDSIQRSMDSLHDKPARKARRAS